MNTRQDLTDEDAIKCPVCGEINAHIAKVEVTQWDGYTDTVFENKEAAKRRTVHNSRGAGVVITYNGECGHAWAEDTHFHKGSTYRASERLPDPPDDGDGCAVIADLWRD